MSVLARRPVSSLVTLSVALRCFVISTLLFLGRVLPSFDASSALLLEPSELYLEPLVRWDTVYFMQIAQRGYEHEQQTAFMPGLPLLMRWTAEFYGRGSGRLQAGTVVWVGALWSGVASTLAVVCMYHLSLDLSRSKRFALASALVYVIPPSWPTFHAVPYTEPLAACFTLLGMVLFVRQQLGLAALAWAVGTFFRAQGVVLGIGFFGWELLLRRPWLGSQFRLMRLLRGIPTFLALTAISIAPFVAFQIWVRGQFCHTLEPRPWCQQGLGLPYDWVQSHYWNVGPFRYWTLLQLPNFFLAAPVLLLCTLGSIRFYATHFETTLSTTLPFLFTAPTAPPSPPSAQILDDSNLVRRLVPFVHLNTALTLLLLVTAHVQIALRVVVTNPVPFWFVADALVGRTNVVPPSSKAVGPVGPEAKLASRRSRWARRWIGYCVVWGCASVILWACFLPPA